MDAASISPHYVKRDPLSLLFSLNPLRFKQLNASGIGSCVPYRVVFHPDQLAVCPFGALGAELDSIAAWLSARQVNSS